MSFSPARSDAVAPLSKRRAWRNALLITLLGCLLLGLGCFVVAGRYLPQRMPLFRAAVVQQLCFALALAVIFLVIAAWQRARGLSLYDLGWRKPTSFWAILLAVALGAAYLSGAYFGSQHVLPSVDVLDFNWTRVLLAPIGVFMAVAEETMMRGFFMTELQRARVSAAAQIVASGACSAIYHAMHDFSLLGFFPSFVLFSLHAGLYVLGRRSLTPSIVAHSIYHVFGEPYLLMMVLASISGQTR